MEHYNRNYSKVLVVLKHSQNLKLIMKLNRATFETCLIQPPSHTVDM